VSTKNYVDACPDRTCREICYSLLSLLIEGGRSGGYHCRPFRFVVGELGMRFYTVLEIIYKIPLFVANAK